MTKKNPKFSWGHDKCYNTFADFQKKHHNGRVQKVTVDAGFSCPNRDGTVATGGCIYCNNRSFNPSYNDAQKSLKWQIDEGVEFLNRRYRNIKKFVVYFQPYSNTHADLATLKRLYQEALDHPDVSGLTIGTRPDCIDESKLDYLQELACDYDITIEYGLESLSDETLKKVNRGHDAAAFFDAVRQTAGRGIKIGTHLIIGFPWEDKSLWLKTAGVLSALPIDFLKIHQLHVVKETALARMYEARPFDLLSPQEYMEIVIEFLERLNPDIVIQRLFGEAPPRTLIAPHWGIRNALLLQMLDEELDRRNSWQGKQFAAVKG